MNLAEILRLAPVIPVLTIEHLKDAVPLARALVKGGLPVIEVTLRTGAGVQAIRAMADEVPEAVVGAGTILTEAQFDKAVAAARQPTFPKRKQALEQLNQELRKKTSDLKDPEKLTASFAAAVARHDLGRLMGQVLAVMLLPAFEAACEAENRAHTREALGQLGFALAAYHAEHDAYPDSLNALAPRYISRIPDDLYTEAPLHYRQEGPGCLLYSVGANGVDDGGRTFDSQPRGDDLVIRLADKLRLKQ